LYAVEIDTPSSSANSRTVNHRLSWSRCIAMLSSSLSSAGGHRWPVVRRGRRVDAGLAPSLQIRWQPALAIDWCLWKPVPANCQDTVPPDSAPLKLAVRWHRRRNGGRRTCRRLERPSRAGRVPCRSLARPAATVTRVPDAWDLRCCCVRHGAAGMARIAAGVDLCM
jgi:hypothetical protein